MSPPDLPDKVKVGPLTFRVVEDDTALMSVSVDKGVVVRGCTDLEALIIHMPTVGAHSARAQVLAHEIGHCVWHVARLDLLDEDGEDLEEAVVARSAPLWLGVIVENPRVVKYLRWQPK